jgi:hypothetical protein
VHWVIHARSIKPFAVGKVVTNSVSRFSQVSLVYPFCILGFTESVGAFFRFTNHVRRRPTDRTPGCDPGNSGAIPDGGPKRALPKTGIDSENIDNSSAKIKILGFCVTKTLEIGCVAERNCI